MRFPSSHGGEYEVQIFLLGCTAVLKNFRPTFRSTDISVDNYFTRQYNPEDNSESPTRLKTLRSSELGRSARMPLLRPALFHVTALGQCVTIRGSNNVFSLCGTITENWFTSQGKVF
jgi:hypothetical protein